MFKLGTHKSYRDGIRALVRGDGRRGMEVVEVDLRLCPKCPSIWRRDDGRECVTDSDISSSEAAASNAGQTCRMHSPFKHHQYLSVGGQL